MSHKTSASNARERLLSWFEGTGARIAITVGPGLLWLLLLLVAPLLFLVAVSFTLTGESYQIIWEPTLSNYVNLLTNEQGPFWQTPFVQSLLLSYFIAATTTVTTLIATFPVAYLLARRSGRLFKVVIYLVLLPFFTVYIVRAYSWYLMFGSGGNINKLLVALGLIQDPASVFNYGVAPIIVGLTHAYFPYMLLTLYASLDGVDFSLVEAARDLGATRTEVFRDVIVPLTLPGIISGSLFVFVPSVGAFITPRFLGQGKVQMIGQLIETRITTLYAIDYGSAASMFIIVSIAIAFVLAFRYVSIEELGGV